MDENARSKLSAVFRDEVVEPLGGDELLHIVTQLRAKLMNVLPRRSAHRTLGGGLLGALLADIRRGPTRGRFRRSGFSEAKLRHHKPFAAYSHAAVQDAPRNLAESLKKHDQLRTAFVVADVEFSFWIEGPRPADRGEPGRGKLLLQVCYEIVGYRRLRDAYFLGSRPVTADPQTISPAITNPSRIEAVGRLDGGVPSILVEWSGGRGPHTRFEVYRDGYLLAHAEATQFTDTLVSAGRPYAYNVRACNDEGCAIGCSPTARGIVAVFEP